jgi:hypothetical protein
MERIIDVDDPNQAPVMTRQPMFEDSYDAMLFNNYFAPDTVINYKMKDNRDFKYCHEC